MILGASVLYIISPSQYCMSYQPAQTCQEVGSNTARGSRAAYSATPTLTADTVRVRQDCSCCWSCKFSATLYNA